MHHMAGLADPNLSLVGADCLELHLRKPKLSKQDKEATFQLWGPSLRKVPNLLAENCTHLVHILGTSRSEPVTPPARSGPSHIHPGTAVLLQEIEPDQELSVSKLELGPSGLLAQGPGNFRSWGSLFAVWPGILL